MDPADFSYEAFAPHKGSIFEVARPDAPPIELRLTEVRRLVENVRTSQFALEFDGPGAPLLAQQILRLHHATLGDLNVFVVPVGADASRVQYEAVFSRML